MKITIQLLLLVITTSLSAQTAVETEFIERFEKFLGSRDLSEIEKVYQKEGSAFEKTYRVNKHLELSMLRGAKGIKIEKLDSDSPYWPTSSKISGSKYEIIAEPPYWLLSVEYKKMKDPIIGTSEGFSTILSERGDKLYIAGFKETEEKD